jgi:3-methyladenine DNA glycosylase/8-oxoguanine DNA glycosylase
LHFEFCILHYMKSSQATRRVIETLSEQHPNADTELHYRNAFELLVATILSAQSTDVRVNMVTPALFKKYPDAKALAGAAAAELEPLILSTGFFRQKSKSLIGMAQKLVAEYNGRVPAEMDADRPRRRRPQDGERGARPCARRARAAGGSPCAAGVEPNRNRRR